MLLKIENAQRKLWSHNYLWFYLGALLSWLDFLAAWRQLAKAKRQEQTALKITT